MWMMELLVRGGAVSEGAAFESLSNVIIVLVHLVEPLGMQHKPLQQSLNLVSTDISLPAVRRKRFAILCSSAQIEHICRD